MQNAPLSYPIRYLGPPDGACAGGAILSDPQPERAQILEAYWRNRESLKAFLDRSASAEHIAEDVIQDVYLELRKHPPTETLRDPVAYLFRVAWHVLMRALKQARQRPQPHDPLEMEPLSRGWEDDPLDELAAEQSLLALLKEFPPAYGAALILRKRDGLTHEQIAQRLGISRGQVRRYIGRVLLRLKRLQQVD